MLSNNQTPGNQAATATYHPGMRTSLQLAIRS